MPSVTQSAQQNVIVVDRSQLGMLKFTGATRLDLLNRMSTNEVNSLKRGEGRATVLTTDIARIIDRLILYTSSDTVYALTGENFNDQIARYLMRFVFFNDDFHIEDVSDNTAIFGVYGEDAADCLATLFGTEIVDLPLHHWRRIELAETPFYLHRTDPIAGDGYFVMCVEADRQLVWERLLNAGIQPVDESTFDYLRIKSGQPRFGRELTQDYIPLEANLWDDVSFNKGCYTGQEIIARMESRGKLAKQLYPLQLSERVEVGMEIQTVAGKNAGILSSVGEGDAGILALGYIKTKWLDQADFRAGQATVTLRTTR